MRTPAVMYCTLKYEIDTCQSSPSPDIQTPDLQHLISRLPTRRNEEKEALFVCDSCVCVVACRRATMVESNPPVSVTRGAKNRVAWRVPRFMLVFPQGHVVSVCRVRRVGKTGEL